MDRKDSLARYSYGQKGQTLMDRLKLLKMLAMLSMIVVIAGGLTRLMRGNSMSLAEYAQQNPPASGASTSESASPTPGVLSGTAAASGSGNTAGSAGNQEDITGNNTSNSRDHAAASDTYGYQDHTMTADPSLSEDHWAESLQTPSQLTGAALNGTTLSEQRVSLTEDFYYEPLSDNLCRFITGISYPAVSSDEEAAALAVSYDNLRYVHVLHYDFDGNPAEGELICNEYIAQDLIEIFYELYQNEYQIERMVLIDEYDGDDTASMEDNNTSCFNYRVVEGSDNLSKHAYGLAIDINPFYNPYVTYEKDGTERVSPAAAVGYADRSTGFPYKIDEEDLCFRLFKEHGFTWGGNWNSLKDYQHFQKTPK